MPVYYFGNDSNPDDRIQWWLDHPPAAVAIDVETVSLKERMPLGFAIAFSPEEAVYVQVYPEPPARIDKFIPLLSNIRIIKVFQNAMFDLSTFPLIPVVGNSLNRANIWDTNVAARLFGYVETSLEMLAGIVGMQATPVSAMISSSQTMLDLDPMTVANKCQVDARVTLRLYLEWYEKINKLYPEYFNIEMQVIPILIDMSIRGLSIDQKMRNELAAKYEDEVKFYKSLTLQHGIENPGSSQQVGYILGSRGNFLPLTRSKKQLSTREEELEFLDDPLAAAVIGYRKKSKFKSTYLDPLAGTDRFYTNYYLDTTVGRLNSRDRNIQNIPVDARCMILPDNGTFTTADYSREHMYLLANFSQDRDMLRVLYDPDPEKNDIHSHTAKKMGVPRKLAKTLNFAVAYGADAKTVSQQAKIRDRNRCEGLIEDWFRTFPGVADWVKYARSEGMKTGWALPTVFGRRIKIQEEFNQWGKLDRAGMERKAVNFPILGSDGEVIKRAIVLCNKRGLGPPVMAITVHDSITWDGDVKDKIPKEELENIPGFRLPIEIKETLRWE